jgi:hypothetical protein
MSTLLDCNKNSTTFYAAISYSDSKLYCKSSVNSTMSYLIVGSVILSSPLEKLSIILFFSLFYKKSKVSLNIYICFSLFILLMVSESLQVTLGSMGVPKYSPTNASICFLIKGINSTLVGFPIPKFSSIYLN